MEAELLEKRSLRESRPVCFVREIKQASRLLYENNRPEA